MYIDRFAFIVDKTNKEAVDTTGKTLDEIATECLSKFPKGTYVARECIINVIKDRFRVEKLKLNKDDTNVLSDKFKIEVKSKKAKKVKQVNNDDVQLSLF